MPQTVLIYRNQLLPLSETFIQAQAGALRRYRPILAGMQRAERSLPVGEDAILAVPDQTRFRDPRKKAYRLLGIAPEFYAKALLTDAALVHAHFAPDGTEAMYLADRLRLPLAVTLHGFDVTMTDAAHRKSLLGRLYLYRRQRLWERASLFICVSDFIHKKALAAGFPGTKLRTHYIGVDRSRFKPSDGQRGKDNVVFVGRLVEKKGCEFLIRAMREVQGRRPGVELIVVGDGPLRAELQGLAGRLGVAARFLGPQTSHEVLACLRKATVAAVPSVEARNGDSEGLPIILLEAASVGLPVVGFRHAGIPEGICDGVTGLLVAERDVEGLAKGLLRVEDFRMSLFGRPVGEVAFPG